MGIEAQFRMGLLPVQLAAIPWSLLCLELAEAGHQPSAPSLFSDHYVVQALVLPLLLGLQWFLTSLLVFSRCIMGGRHVSLGHLARSLGACLGTPLLLAFVLPDYLAWRTGGFEAMTSIAPISGLFCLLLIGLSGTRAIEAQAGISRLEAFKILAGSLFIASLPILLLVR
jgi:hypothetical protein